MLELNREPLTTKQVIYKCEMPKLSATTSYTQWFSDTDLDNLIAAVTKYLKSQFLHLQHVMLLDKYKSLPIDELDSELIGVYGQVEEVVQCDIQVKTDLVLSLFTLMPASHKFFKVTVTYKLLLSGITKEGWIVGTLPTKTSYAAHPYYLKIYKFKIPIEQVGNEAVLIPPF